MNARIDGEGWIGVISDTHALVRPEALEALEGCAHILHAGDVGSALVLEELRRLAPVTAVRGNNDHGDWARELPAEATHTWAGEALHVLHDLAHLDDAVLGSGPAAVVTGHSHRPSCEERDGVLYLNPGSAGPRRFRLPVTVARLWRADAGLQAEIVELEVSR